MDPGNIRHTARTVGGCTALELSGDLSLISAAHVWQLLCAALLDRGRILVDVSALTVSSARTVALFPAVLTETGGWPLARLVLVGAGPELAAALRRARVDAAVPLAADWEDALRLVGRRPERVSRQQRMPASTAAGLLARAAVADMCRDWEIEDLSFAAAVVATELVSNAAQHAGTPSTLACTLSHAGLHVSVRDGKPLEGTGSGPTGSLAGVGQGLLLVESLADSWGVTRHSDGKSVWAVLRFVGRPG